MFLSRIYKPYKCQACGIRYHSRTMLKLHYEEHSGASGQHCKDCGANYPVSGYHRC